MLKLFIISGSQFTEILERAPIFNEPTSSPFMLYMNCSSFSFSDISALTFWRKSLPIGVKCTPYLSLINN